ncbi:MAG: serpin family protein [Clostridia bacterium]|nr:serpin family protein [Clostridia bacterium]
MKKKLLSLLLLTVLLFGLVACTVSPSGNSGTATDPSTDSSGESSKPTENEPTIDPMVSAYVKFSFELVKQLTANDRGENRMISPLSAITALSLAANGASGETRTEMERVLGATAEEWNANLKQYYETLAKSEYKKPSEEEGILYSANRVWYRENVVTPNPNFVKIASDYYGAQVLPSRFDQDAVNEVNQWVSESTNGQIENLVDEFSWDTWFYIVNALGFEALWNVQNRGELPQGVFTNSQGEEETATYLNTRLYGAYFEINRGEGFVRHLKGNYDFVAILPPETTTPEQFLQYLDGEALINALRQPSYSVELHTSMPKFSFEDEVSLEGVLQQMGMYRAFDPKYYQSFSELGTSEERLFIRGVHQKTVIEVTETGIKAAAVTGIPVGSPGLSEKKTLELNRPFLFMIVDDEYRLPIFIGIVNSVE